MNKKAILCSKYWGFEIMNLKFNLYSFIYIGKTQYTKNEYHTIINNNFSEMS